MTDSTDLESKLNYTFNNRQLLEESLVHSSLLNENPGTVIVSNERLEYLGDAVLGLVTAHELFLMMPKADEGVLTHLRSRLVCRATLGFLAKKIDLGAYLSIGRGEEASGGRSKAANLASGLEALLGAVYLDGGLDAAGGVIRHIFGKHLQEFALNEMCADSKSNLQEFTQAKKMGTPTYRIVGSSGPVHEPYFTAEVLLNDKVIAAGSGKSKKLAEANAAYNALNAMSAE